MKNNTKVLYDLSIKDELAKYKQNLGNISPDFKVKLNEKDLTITVDYHGKKLKSTQLGGGQFNDTLILNRTSHKNISLADLEKIGTIYQVESSTYNIDFFNFDLDPSLKVMNIETILYLDGDIDERAKIVEAIKNHSIVNIIDDGRSSDEDFAAIEKGVEEIKKQLDDSLDFEVSVSQDGPIWIGFEIEKPKTFGDLIDQVIKTRGEVYSEK